MLLRHQPVSHIYYACKQQACCSAAHLLQVPHTGSEAWTAAIHRKKQPTAAAAATHHADDDFADEEAAENAAAGIVAPWQPWYNSETPAQVAGYVVEYDSGLTYATVKGAGEEARLGCCMHCCLDPS
jgi:hypothetical protein